MNQLDEICAQLDIELLPWQREMAEAVLSGKRLTYYGGRCSGRTRVWEVVDAALNARDPYVVAPTKQLGRVWAQEHAHRFTRTPRIISGFSGIQRLRGTSDVPVVVVEGGYRPGQETPRVSAGVAKELRHMELLGNITLEYVRLR